jgi:hypothetical protein
MNYITWYTNMCDIMVMDLLYRFDSMVKCVCCYMGLGSNDYFVTSAVLTGSHYKTYIISGMGHSRSNSVGLLVL